MKNPAEFHSERMSDIKRGILCVVVLGVIGTVWAVLMTGMSSEMRAQDKAARERAVEPSHVQAKQKLVESLSAELAKAKAPEGTAIRVWMDDKTKEVIYQSTLTVSMPSTVFSVKLDETREKMFEYVCTKDGARAFFDNDGVYRFEYRNPEGKVLGGFDVSLNACRQAGYNPQK